ncbi:MAG: hypothetical protein LKG27_06000 [Clostridiaceae bacterium]|jgi:hypothetical protein|nr:hypothetical protein [Clostridiaceae bacterium]
MGNLAIPAIRLFEQRPMKVGGFGITEARSAGITPKFTQTACNTIKGNPNHPECRSDIVGNGCYYLA